MRAARRGTAGLPRARGVHGSYTVFLHRCRYLRIRRREYLPGGRRQLRVRTRTRNRAAGNHARGTRRNGCKLLMKQPTAPIGPACLRARSRPGAIWRRREHGWTLIELVMVIVILGLLAAMGAGLLSSVFRSYFAARDITSSDGQARAAFERMTRELRQVRTATATDLDVASTAQFRFIDSDGN